MVSNYPGIENISGADYATNLFNQVTNLGVEVKFETVLSIDEEKNVTTDKDSYKAKAIILATGAENRKLKIENEDNLVGKGVKTAFGVVSKFSGFPLDAGTSILNEKQLRDFGWEVAKEFYKTWLKDGHTKEDIPQYILDLENDM
jgi:hypothetical protein